MKLLNACKICGSTDDWEETENKDYYFCQNCQTESHKGSMKIKCEFYGHVYENEEE